MLKRGNRPGESSQHSFQLPDHVSNQLSPDQSAEQIATYFASISQEYNPLNINTLPPSVQSHMSVPLCDEMTPELEPWQVHRRILRAKKPNSSVKGDVQVKLVKEFSVELAGPVSVIFNKITKTQCFPQQWKIEYGSPIPKVQPPMSEDDLRIISKTPFFSKIYESFVADWLMPVIEPFLDPGQCGLKGLSITHYLIKFLHFTHSTLDKRQPHAVLAAYVDLSKAFNRVSHNHLIEDLFDMHCPSWLLKIIASYLSDRSLVLTFNKHQASVKSLPGGGPQGAFLGVLIFIIIFNSILLRPPIPRSILGPLKKQTAVSVKYIDDSTLGVSLNLKECLQLDQKERPKPLTFHQRTGHVLPPENNLLQLYLTQAEIDTSNKLMKINKNKTTVMLFNRSRSYDFNPEVQFKDGTTLECVCEV